MTTILLHHYVEQVEKLIDNNRLVEAIEHCRHILHSYPRHIDTYRVMGKALLEKQEYSAANDLFLRILCADPNDFISHVGLSIIYKEERQTEQALWHLERAYEIQPYNVAIQGELRKLYADQTDVRPGVIPLTRGALARLYMQGELYQQAISELRRILAEEPDRVDIKALLAEALWRDDERIDAEEVCLKILDELPNCIVANAILAEIWLHTGRIAEAQKYLHRLHGLTWQTQSLLDKETIEGQAFATEGAFSLPAEASLDFLQTGEAEPDKPAQPTDDWVKEVRFDNLPADAAKHDQVVQEAESGMHSYDWLADIGEMAEDEETAVASESDWFSQSQDKQSLKLSTSELNAEWLADLRNQESDSGFQPLDMSEIGDDLFEDTKPNGTDWFAEEDEISDEEIAAFGLDVDNDTAVSTDSLPPAKGLPNWLNDLDDEKPAIEIDATNLMDDSLINWAESESSVVVEPKTPFWLSEMADEEMEAVQLNPEEMLDWMNDPDAEEFEEEELADNTLLANEEVEQLQDDLSFDDLSFLDGIVQPEQDEPQSDELEFGPTAVLNTGELDEAPPLLSETDALGGADDWLAALTEDGLDETLDWDELPAAEKAQMFDEIDLVVNTDELAALGDNDDWLQSAAADLDAILEVDEREEDEFPNLAIPELDGDDITSVPDWLAYEEIDLSEEAEATVSSEDDSEKTPKPEKPEMEPADALDWLDDLTSEPEDDATPLPEPPIETEGMPSWLTSAKDAPGVEMVDEWNSASADIPDWLQEPVSLTDLDDDEALPGEDFEDSPGLTGLLAEIDLTDEPLPIDQMDSLFSDWLDEEDDVSLTADSRLSGADDFDDDLFADDVVDETAVTNQPQQPAEMGLTGLLSNLTFNEAEASDDEISHEDATDFMSRLLADVPDDNIDEFLFDDLTADQEASLSFDEMIDLDDLEHFDMDEVSLTAMLSDFDPEEESEAQAGLAVDEDDWLSDLSSLADSEEAPEADSEAQIGLTGMLANLWPDEAGDDETETAVPADPALPELDDFPTDELGLTELLAGIDYVADAADAEPDLYDYNIQPVEPSLTETLLEIGVDSESEAENLPVSAEDTTWLTQLEADTGALQQQQDSDDYDMAEESGLDWLTLPEEPEEEPAPPIEPKPAPAEIAELDGVLEDWDDAMSWLEDLAAQQDEPVEELPSIATTMLDEELDSAEALALDASAASSMDWLDELTSAESEADEWDEEFADGESRSAQVVPPAADAPQLEMDDLPDNDDEISWLDQLATDNLDSSKWYEEDEAETVAEPEESVAQTPADHAWLDELAADDDLADTFEFEEAAPLFADLTDTFDSDQLEEIADLDTAVDEPDLGWLDEMIAEPSDGFADDDLEEETEAEPIVTGVTDALSESSGIAEAEADLEEALAWLDELDEELEVDWLDEAPPTQVNLPPDEPDLADEPETIVVMPEPDALTLALNRLEQQVLQEGIAVPVTAVRPLTLSQDELHAALDWIEQAEAAPPAEPELEEDDSWLETAVTDDDDDDDDDASVAEDDYQDDFDLSAMSDDPEAWLEQLLTDDLSQDAPDEPPSTPLAEPPTDSLLDDLALDGLPEDPDAAIAWLGQLASDDDEVDLAQESWATQPDDDGVHDFDQPAAELDEMDSAPFDFASMEDDPEAWLEQMLSGDLDMDIDMEPPPIKPSEDAMFVTGDALAAETASAEPEPAEQEPELAALPEPPEVADAPDPFAAEDETDSAAFELASMEDDPEAWLEQMLSGEFDMDVEMELPPIKPSEDAMFATDDSRRYEALPADEAEIEDSDGESDAEIEFTDMFSDAETDIIGDVPDDPDEAMAWLEQLAARQGAAIDELPSVTDPDAEPQLPDWMNLDLAELPAEPTLTQADEGGEGETAVSLVADLSDDDIDFDLPDWLEPSTDDQNMGQTGWLRSLPDVDMETWLTAEEEATLVGPVEEVQLPDTGPLKAPTPPPPPVELDDNLFEPVPEPSSGAYSVDESQLHSARQALADGRIAEAVSQFNTLVAAGSGMMTIIAELEQATIAHGQAPALSQALGDAYMRNGQLQKALAAYRTALDQM